MTMTPREIQEKQFHDAFRGYSHEEVDLFIDQVSDAYDQIFRDNQALRNRVEELEEQLRSGAPAASRHRTDPPPPVRSESEDMLKRMLVTAQETADKAVQTARAKAQGMIEEAEAKVRRLQEQAEALSSSTLHDAQRRAREMLSAAAGEEKDLRDRIDGLRTLERDFRGRLASFIRSQLELLEARPPLQDGPSVGLGSSFFDRKMLSGGDKLPGLGPKATGHAGVFEPPAAPARAEGLTATASEPTKAAMPGWLSSGSISEPQAVPPVRDEEPPRPVSDEEPPRPVSDEEAPKWPEDPEADRPDPGQHVTSGGSHVPPDPAGAGAPVPPAAPAAAGSEPGAGNPKGSTQSTHKEETRSIRELFWGED